MKKITILFCLLIFISIGIFIFTKVNRQSLLTKTDQPQVKSVETIPYIKAEGTQFVLNGLPYQFVGFNVYNLATLWGSNAGCGGQVDDLNAFFSLLRPNSTVRMWAFQGSMATNVYTKQIDWTGLDRVVNAASANGHKLIMVLSNQDGTCDDGHWKDKTWYNGGYHAAFNDDGRGLAPLPFLDYAKLVVDRYKNSTTVAFWELVNEPESSDCQPGYKGSGCYGNQLCTDEIGASQALRFFFDDVGTTLKNIDHNHLISSGVMGNGQCGTIFEDYGFVHQSPGIDVASYHDYGNDDKAMPGDQWNGLQKRLNQTRQLNKPLLIGEVGMLAKDNSLQCSSYSVRKDKIKAKLDSQFSAGIAGLLIWDLTGGTSSICNFDVVNSDPLIQLIREYPVFMDPLISPTVVISETPVPFASATVTVFKSPTPFASLTAVPSKTPTVSLNLPSPTSPVERGVVSGIVTNNLNVPIANIKVTLNNKLSNRNTFTNQVGFYTFPIVTSGVYSISFTGGKYQKLTTTVNVLDNQTTTLNVKLVSR